MEGSLEPRVPEMEKGASLANSLTPYKMMRRLETENFDWEQNTSSWSR